MLRRIAIVFICCVGLSVSNRVVAQPPPPPPPGPLSGTDVPFDTHSAAFLISALSFGIYKIGKRKKKEQFNSLH